MTGLPITAGMLQRAAELDAEAAKLSAKSVQTSGAIEAVGTGVDALVEVLATRAHAIMAPPMPTVIDWAATGAEEARRDWNVQTHKGRAGADELRAVPLRFTLIWSGDDIDTKRSGVTVADPRVRDERGDGDVV